MRFYLALASLVASAPVICTSAWAQAPRILVPQGPGAAEIEAVRPNIVRIHFEPTGQSTPRTLVMDPNVQPAADSVRLEKNGSSQILSSPEMKVIVTTEQGLSVEVQDGAGKTLVTLRGEAGGGGGRRGGGGGPAIVHDENEHLYGIKGLELDDSGLGILRDTGGAVLASRQGGAGGPFFFTTRYGVLVDSDGGNFQMQDETIRFQKSSRPDAEYFVIVGAPLRVMSGLAQLTGRPPMPPKWTLGFLNSQWVSTEDEWRRIAATYSQKDIPVSGFIFDFDWKAWGEDNYGEWRWNSTSGPGNSGPDKFPDGASGKFAADMLAQGIHLAGILKPRILLNTADGKPTVAAQYATDHNFWYPNEIRNNDYFTHRPAANIDFSNADARQWYWQHLVPAFQSGIKGWWDDEADYDGPNTFGNFQFMNMARALYDGQRSMSDERVWSINRNYYLGAMRYAYAEWSGDIRTGFQSMAYQRRRMVATLDLGEPEWSMDTGGFHGHPSPENYARWMEFGAFVPVFRVHGGSNEKRQPWEYGEIAEAAAKKAMRLRFDLMPYIYSNARMMNETGIGIVRPLFWEFPNDERCADDARAWMFGDALLVSPVVERNLPTHGFYLPEGDWFDYATGKPVAGGRDMHVPVDSRSWQDIPIYVRDGSILATQPAERGNELSPKAPLVLDVFPSAARAASFVAYDDDGHTYGYEKGDFFRQEIDAKRDGGATDIDMNAATGSYRATFTNYLLRVHYAGKTVVSDGSALRKFASEAAFQASSDPGWFTATDRFGAVTEIRLPVDSKAHALKLSAR